MNKYFGRRDFIRDVASILSAASLSSCASSGVGWHPFLTRIYPVPEVDPTGQKYNSRPKMMAIGDSLYQGVRSLSIAPNMIKLSPPSLISQKLGIEFITPDYPIPIGWNIEDIYKNRYPLLIEGILFPYNILTNIKSWDHLSIFRNPVRWSRHDAFDNIAVGGATISDLWKQTSGFADRRFRSNLNSLADLNTPIPADLWSDLWFDMNTSLTLNPSKQKCQDNKSQIQQVQDREPENLFVNIGSNDGLFVSCFQGRIGRPGPNNVPSLDPLKYKTQIEELFMRLSDVSKKTERIFFNSLVRPRSIPNLMPPTMELKNKPEDGYYDGYSANLFSEELTISGKDLCDFDNIILDLNEFAKNKMNKYLKERGFFIDIYRGADKFDAKHYKNRAVQVSGQTITNTPIEFKPDGTVSSGGLTGLDNMHPTGPGYAMYAGLILDALKPGYEINIDGYYKDDWLMSVPAKNTYRRPKEVRSLVKLFDTISKIT